MTDHLPILPQAEDPLRDGSDGAVTAAVAEKTPSRGISVIERVRDSILSSEFAPGARINEVHLARALGVSRTPVRTALHALAAEGLLDYAQNRGFSVRELPIQALRDAYEIRAALEGLACRFAAERGLDDAQRQAMQQALHDGDAIIGKPELGDADLAAYRAMNVMFHDAILAASQNRMLAEAVRRTLNMPGATNRHIVAFSLHHIRRRHDDHHRLYDLILAGQGWRAEQLMREHVLSLAGLAG